MSNLPETSPRYDDLPGGAIHADVYAALALVVPPSEPHWLPSIAVAVQELVDTCPWLGRELRYYVPRLQGLPDLVEHLRSRPPDHLPKDYVADFPAQAALAVAPTQDSWLRHPKALMLVVALRVVCPSQSEESSPDIRAKRGFAELSRFCKGLNFVNVRQSREAFLKTAARESSPLDYATALSHYMEHPKRLQPSLNIRSAKPDSDLLRVLKRDIIPLLRELPAPKRKKKVVRETEGWERDDGGLPDVRINLELRPAPGSIDDLPAEDSVEIAFDHISNLRRVKVDELADFDDPYARRPSVTQAIHSANTFLSTFHADALTKPEIELLLPAILEFLDDAIRERDPQNVSLLLTLLLMFSTGLTKERSIAILTNNGSSLDDAPYLSGSCEELIAPALNPKSTRQQGDRNQGLVFDQDRHIRIPLPPTLASHLRDFRYNFPSGLASTELLSNIYPLLRLIADSVGLTAATLGRLRRTAAPLLFNECKDLVAVMHLTRDTFGRSLAPLHYVSFDASVLRGIYRRAMWPHLGDDHRKANESEACGQSRLGSAFCPLPQSARAACANIGAILHAGKPRPGNATSREIAVVHNAMADHLAAILTAVVGHRPNQALSKLTIHDFDLDLQLGLFADKDIDPAHLTRLVAIGQEVSNQLERYIRHLHGLIECKNLPAGTVGRLRKTLKGGGPLIFRLDEYGHQRRWNAASWQNALPAQWRSLQPNFGRHYLASRGRELEFSPEWIHIQLGHQDVVGYPFSPDSPLFPIDLAQKVGPLMDQIFKEQGWKRRNGFQPVSFSPDSWAETGRMRVGYSHTERDREKLNEARKRFKNELRAQLRPLKSQAERILLEKVREVSLPLSQTLCFRFNAQRQKRKEQLLDWPIADQRPPKYLKDLSPAKLELPQMVSLLGILEQEAGGNRPLQIALTNQLAYGLEWLRKRDKYLGPYCGAYRMRPLPDESPFYKGIFRATKQIRALRSLFTGLETSPFKKGTPEQSEWELGKAALAVCIYGQVEDLSITWGLFSASAQVERIPACPNALLVHLPEAGTTVGLHGASALAYSRWKRLYGGLENSAEHAEHILNEALNTVLPRQCLRKGQGIQVLLKTVHVANRVEMPGLFRTILDLEQGAVALPPDRLRSLLDPAYRAAGTIGSGPELRNWSLKRNHSISKIDAQVRVLQSLIPDDDKKVTLPLTQEIIQLKAKQYEPARDKLLAELHRWRDDEEHDPIVRLLAGWLGHLTQRPKLRGEGRLAWSTVGDYFSKVALPLVGSVGRGGLKELSADDLEDLYLDLLEQLPEDKQADAYTQLLSFHDYLENEHGFEPIDVSNFREFVSKKTERRSVSNQIVLPAERDVIGAHLQWLNDPDAHPEGSQTEFRLHTQAFLCFSLAASTGARISEIAGLKHNDVIRIGDEIALILRPNGYRRLKTPSARRLVDAGKFLTLEVKQKLSRWLDAERDRIGPNRFHAQHVFCDLQDELVGTAVLRSWYTPTLKAVNSQVSSHHLRHTRVNEIFLELLLGIFIQELYQPGRAEISPKCPSSLPRELMIETGQIGHRRPRTSAICYFHMPFAAAIAAQRRLHGHNDKARSASVMGISTSGVDNLVQTWKEDHVARFLDRCCRRRDIAGALGEPDKNSLPGPVVSSLPRLSMAVDLMARGKSVAAVRESVGLSTAQVELILEQDRRQAINTGIALIAGNPNGNARNSTYPRWRAGSIVLQSLWRKAELEQAPKVHSLLRGWRLAANRSNRSEFVWDNDLIKMAEECLTDYPTIKVDKKPQGNLYVVTFKSHECVINHEVAFALAVADVVAATLDSSKPSAPLPH